MKRTFTVGLVAVAQLGFVGAAVAPQLSAHLTGDTYVLRVAPVDPIDPFRGAYVQLSYPDLDRDLRQARRKGWRQGGDDSDVFVTLRRSGDVWVADGHGRTRPDGSPYLVCASDGWQPSCGIESWFLPQDEALEMERDLADGAYAEIRVDDAGHAVLIDVRSSP